MCNCAVRGAISKTKRMGISLAISKINGIKVKGRGLMLGLEFNFEVKNLRDDLIYKKHIFTGGSSNKNLLRILPPLNIKKNDLDKFFKALNELI